MCSLPVFGFIGWQRPPVMDKIPAGMRNEAVASAAVPALALLVVTYWPYVANMVLVCLISVYLTTLHVAKIIEMSLVESGHAVELTPEINLSKLVLRVNLKGDVAKSMESNTGESESKITESTIRKRMLDILNQRPELNHTGHFFSISTPRLNDAVRCYFLEQKLPELKYNNMSDYYHNYETISSCIVADLDIQEWLALNPYDPNAGMDTESSGRLGRKLLMDEMLPFISGKTICSFKIETDGSFGIAHCFDVLDEFIVNDQSDSCVCEIQADGKFLTAGEVVKGRVRFDPPILLLLTPMTNLRARIYKSGKPTKVSSIRMGGRSLVSHIRDHLVTKTTINVKSISGLEVFEYKGGCISTLKGSSELNTHPVFVRSCRDPEEQNTTPGLS